MADLAATQTSKTQNWETPKWLFDLLDEEFNFDLDVCATDDNTLCEYYFTEEENGLEQEWWGVAWCNPPYGSQAKFWVEKAYKEAEKGNCTVVLLIASRTDTRYFWDYVRHGEVRFLKRRLKFGGNDGKYSAPFPSVVVVFRKGALESSTVYWEVREDKKYANSIQ